MSGSVPVIMKVVDLLVLLKITNLTFSKQAELGSQRAPRMFRVLQGLIRSFLCLP